MLRSLFFKNILLGLVALLGVYVALTGDISFSGPRYRALTYMEIVVEQAEEAGATLASLEIPSIPLIVPASSTVVLDGNGESDNNPAVSRPENIAGSTSVPASQPGTQDISQDAPKKRYFAQLASVSDNDEVRAELARLERRHASLLGEYDLNLQRADLGARGVFHRLLVGPFQERSDAARFCGKLLEANRDCLVLKTNADLVRPL